MTASKTYQNLVCLLNRRLIRHFNIVIRPGQQKIFIFETKSVPPPSMMMMMQLQWETSWGSGCGSVGWAVDSYPRVCSSKPAIGKFLNRTFVYSQLYWKDKNKEKEKEAGNGPLKNVLRLSPTNFDIGQTSRWPKMWQVYFGQPRKCLLLYVD